jgi:tryptophan halogenase
MTGRRQEEVSTHQGPIQVITILGGGTAGWLAANYLHTALHKAQHGLDVTIQVIETPAIATVGVGEATIPSLRATMNYLGLDEKEWMTRCNATFKLGIKFVGWTKSTDDEPTPTYWHPFERPPEVNNLSLMDYWLQKRANGSRMPFGEACAITPHLCNAKRSPKSYDDEPYASNYRYAYHLDAALLAEYLREVAISRGVRHIQDKVSGVVLNDEGWVDHLVTEEHGNIFGHLFIDCSGFRGIIINGALDEPFIPFGDYLFCDQAVAMRVPARYENSGIDPFTTATALSSGWTWDIPLLTRKGIGYVYSSSAISESEAERELRTFIGEPSRDVEAMHIRMRVGRTRHCWVKNCVSVGLAGGFIEPLESTGIYLIEVGLRMLVECFPDRSLNPSLRNRYNDIMRSVYEDIRDFIIMHYCTTDRDDSPFWIQNNHHPNIPAELAEKLERWSNMIPTSNDISNRLAFFEEQSYQYVLAGMNHLPKTTSPRLAYLDESAADRMFTDITLRSRAAMLTAPDHYHYHLVRRGRSDGVEKGSSADLDQLTVGWRETLLAGRRYLSEAGALLLQQLQLLEHSSDRERLLWALKDRQHDGVDLNEISLAINLAIREQSSLTNASDPDGGK